MAPSAGFWRHRGSPPDLTAEELHATAFSMLVARRAMRGTLPAALIHDAPLDMLLNLYVSRPATIRAAALAAETTVAPVVAGHWIEAIKAEGLVTIREHALALSDRGVAAMETMLTAVVGSQRAILGWGNH